MMEPVGNPASCICTAADVVAECRRIIVGSDGVLWSMRDELHEIAIEQLFAVLVLWDEKSHASWCGWLTTTDHRSACFGPRDLEDPLLERWFADLPNWDPCQLSFAVTRPGLHLVWRHRE